MPVGSNNVLAAKGILLVSLVFALAACTAGNGEGLDQNGQPIPPGPTGASDFQQIQDTIFTPICSACHIGANAPQGMRLDAANSYAMIVGVPSNEVPGLMRINPGNPDTSYLVQKIQGNAAQGVRMPANGPPYLTQDQIDLVRRWVAAGAPPASVAPNNLIVSSSIPAAGEVAAAGLDKLTVIFAGDVDASLAASGTFELRDGFDQPVALAKVRVPEGRPRVVELTLAHALPAGSYQLEVRGQGPVALADTAGHVLDGDADGTPGGDFLMSFDVSAGASR
jgi:mono/diheme cytochrome c family protein